MHRISWADLMILTRNSVPESKDFNPDSPDPEAVLTSVPDEEFELLPVSEWVNNARHEGPKCLASIRQRIGAPFSTKLPVQ